MKKLTVIMLIMIIAGWAKAQKIALKNNLVYNVTATPNLALEIGTGSKTTLDLYAGYHPFTFGDNKKFKHWLVQPGFRYWTCERFNGLFFGAHIHGGEFNFTNIRLPFGLYKGLRNNRYEGHFYGGGISIGYQWVLGNRWNLEAEAGAGYARIYYDKYACRSCSPKTDSGHRNYFGPTKASLSIVFLIR